MTKEVSTHPPQRTYKVDDMVAAARKGAAKQIERMKAMLSEIRAQRIAAEGEQDEQSQQPSNSTDAV